MYIIFKLIAVPVDAKPILGDVQTCYSIFALNIPTLKRHDLLQYSFNDKALIAI